MRPYGTGVNYVTSGHGTPDLPRRPPPAYVLAPAAVAARAGRADGRSALDLVPVDCSRRGASRPGRLEHPRRGSRGCCLSRPAPGTGGGALAVRSPRRAAPRRPPARKRREPPRPESPPERAQRERAETDRLRAAVVVLTPTELHDVLFALWAAVLPTDDEFAKCGPGLEQAVLAARRRRLADTVEAAAIRALHQVGVQRQHRPRVSFGFRPRVIRGGRA